MYFRVRFCGVQQVGYSCLSDLPTEWSTSTHTYRGVECRFGRNAGTTFIKVEGPVENAEAAASVAARYSNQHLPLIVPEGTELLGEMEYGSLEGPVVARGQSGQVTQYIVETPWGLALQELTQPDEVCLNTKS